MLGDLLLDHDLLTVLVSELEERALHADFLYTTLCNDIIAVHVKQLVLD